MKNVCYCCILLLFSTVSLVAAGEPAADTKRQQQFHRFLVAYKTVRYALVFHGTITRIIPEGYRKDGRVYDVLAVRVDKRIKPTTGRAARHLLYSRRNFSFKKGGSHIFFTTAEGRLSFIDPPLPVTRAGVTIDDRTYPLKEILQWTEAARKTTLRSLIAKNRPFYSAKRVRERQAGFLIKMRRKEILLLHKINSRLTLLEKVSYLLELGHTRIALGNYKTAANAFRYVKQKYRVAPITTLMAERGLALLLFYQDKTAAAIKRFKTLLLAPGAATGYRATLRNDLARLYEKQKAYDKATAQYRLAASEFPDRHHDRAFALFNLGELQRRDKRYREALKSYRASYTLFNTHLAASFRKGNTRFPAWYFALQKRIRRKGR